MKVNRGAVGRVTQTSNEVLMVMYKLVCKPLILVQLLQGCSDHHLVFSPTVDIACFDQVELAAAAVLKSWLMHADLPEDSDSDLSASRAVLQL